MHIRTAWHGCGRRWPPVVGMCLQDKLFRSTERPASHPTGKSKVHTPSWRRRLTNGITHFDTVHDGKVAGITAKEWLDSLVVEPSYGEHGGPSHHPEKIETASVADHAESDRVGQIARTGTGHEYDLLMKTCVDKGFSVNNSRVLKREISRVLKREIIRVLRREIIRVLRREISRVLRRIVFFFGFFFGFFYDFVSFLVSVCLMCFHSVSNSLSNSARIGSCHSPVRSAVRESAWNARRLSPRPVAPPDAGTAQRRETRPAGPRPFPPAPAKGHVDPEALHGGGDQPQSTRAAAVWGAVRRHVAACRLQSAQTLRRGPADCYTTHGGGLYHPRLWRHFMPEQTESGVDADAAIAGSVQNVLGWSLNHRVSCPSLFSFLSRSFTSSWLINNRLFKSQL